MSFQILDKEGKKVHIKDIVSYPTTTQMGDVEEKQGFIVCLLPENMLEVQPETGGVPLLIPACHVSVVQSIIMDILSLKSNGDFQRMMLEAQHRFLIEKSNSKKVKGSGLKTTGVNSRVGRKSVPAEAIELEI